MQGVIGRHSSVVANANKGSLSVSGYTDWQSYVNMVAGIVISNCKTDMTGTIQGCNCSVIFAVKAQSPLGMPAPS